MTDVQHRFRVPHPLVLLTGCIILASMASYVLPAGEFERSMDEETDLAGFQLAARYGTGSEEGLNAGQIHPIDDRIAVSIGTNGVRYAHQTRQGSRMAASDSTSWSMEWIAPSTGNSVVFHVAANSGNGDNSPLSDLVYSADLTIESAPPQVGWRLRLFSALPLLLLMALWISRSSTGR